MSTRRANIARALVFAFLLNSTGPMPLAQAERFYLPAPGQMVALSPAYNPAVLKGIKLDADNPFRFHFFVAPGDSIPNHMSSPNVLIGDPDQEQLKQQTTRLIKYFLASLTIPEKDLWVNLSPYEKDRIIPSSFGQTEMGRDLLAQDYILKQITASLIYPESRLGKEFWQRIYAQAQAKYGTTNVPINTFNKVWIIPDKAVVYENGGTAFVLENHLKVMLEEDYLSTQKHCEKNVSFPNAFVGNLDPRQKHSGVTDVSSLGSQIVREIVIPALTKEVNEGKNFAPLRQVFYSLILATWYKNKIKESILNKIYADRNKTDGVQYDSSVILSEVKDHKASKDSSATPQNDIEGIYQRYLQAFKKGVYNYIKEEPSFPPLDGEGKGGVRIPRKYFSGGVSAEGEARAIKPVAKISPAQIAALNSAQLVDTEVSMAIMTPHDAQNSSQIQGKKIFIIPSAADIGGETPAQMRKFFTEHEALVRPFYERASQELGAGFSIDRLLLASLATDRTNIIVLCIAHALYVYSQYEVLKQESKNRASPDFITGDSVGLLISMVLSGALTIDELIMFFENGLEEMEEMAKKTHYGIVIVPFIEPEQLNEVLVPGRIEALGYSPKRVSIAVLGDSHAVHQTASLIGAQLNLAAHDIKVIYPPSIKAAHHSFYGSRFDEIIHDFVDQINFQIPGIPVIDSSVAQTPILRTAQDVKTAFSRAILGPVYWVQVEHLFNGTENHQLRISSDLGSSQRLRNFISHAMTTKKSNREQIPFDDFIYYPHKRILVDPQGKRAEMLGEGSDLVYEFKSGNWSGWVFRMSNEEGDSDHILNDEEAGFRVGVKYGICPPYIRGKIGGSSVIASRRVVPVPGTKSLKDLLSKKDVDEKHVKAVENLFRTFRKYNLKFGDVGNSENIVVGFVDKKLRAWVVDPDMLEESKGPGIEQFYLDEIVDGPSWRKGVIKTRIVSMLNKWISRAMITEVPTIYQPVSSELQRLILASGQSHELRMLKDSIASYLMGRSTAEDLRLIAYEMIARYKRDIQFDDQHHWFDIATDVQVPLLRRQGMISNYEAGRWSLYFSYLEHEFRDVFNEIIAAQSQTTSVQLRHFKRYEGAKRRVLDQILIGLDPGYNPLEGRFICLPEVKRFILAATVSADGKLFNFARDQMISYGSVKITPRVEISDSRLVFKGHQDVTFASNYAYVMGGRLGLDGVSTFGGQDVRKLIDMINGFVKDLTGYQVTLLKDNEGNGVLRVDMYQTKIDEAEWAALRRQAYSPINEFAKLPINRPYRLEFESSPTGGLFISLWITKDKAMSAQQLLNNPFMRYSLNRDPEVAQGVREFLNRDHPFKEEIFNKVDGYTDDEVMSALERILPLPVDHLNKGLATYPVDDIRQFFLHPSKGDDDFMQVMANIIFVSTRANIIHFMSRPKDLREQLGKLRARIENFYLVIRGYEILSRRADWPLFKKEDLEPTSKLWAYYTIHLKSRIRGELVTNFLSYSNPLLEMLLGQDPDKLVLNPDMLVERLEASEKTDSKIEESIRNFIAFRTKLMTQEGWATELTRESGLDEHNRINYLNRITMLENALAIIDARRAPNTAQMVMAPVHRQGGINLNPAQMSLQVKKDVGAQDFKFNFKGTEIDAAQVTGATFSIDQMTPVTNLLQILGLN